VPDVPDVPDVPGAKAVCEELKTRFLGGRRKTGETES
jgi:hypothetical protein